MFGKTTRRNVVGVGCAERMRGLLELRVELLENRLHGANDEREGHEHHREDDRRPREGDVDADRGGRP